MTASIAMRGVSKAFGATRVLQTFVDGARVYAASDA